MPVAKKKVLNLPPDRLAAGFCRRPDVRTDWWTDVHRTVSHKLCQHSRARHLCLAHCPVLAQCREDTPAWKTDWQGMVVAGSLRAVYDGQPAEARTQPPEPLHCRFCTP